MNRTKRALAYLRLAAECRNQAFESTDRKSIDELLALADAYDAKATALVEKELAGPE